MTSRFLLDGLRRLYDQGEIGVDDSGYYIVKRECKDNSSFEVGGSHD